MLRPEPPHVAQQSRREKLRVPPPASPSAASHQNFYESPFPPPLDFTSGGAGCSDSGSPHFFNQFDGGGGGIWRSSDWVLNAPFLAATSQLGELHFPSLPYSPYPLHEVVSSSSSSSMVNQALEIPSLVAPPMASMDGASEMLLMPSYGGNAASVWTNRVAENWSGKADGGFGATVAGETTQGLSLSLSSNPPRVAQMEERFAQRFAGGAFQGIAGGGRPAAGPLGPFTGYATILKSSKFLKPAQQLLDEFCCAVAGSRASKKHDVAGKRLVSGSGDELCGAWAERNSVASSSSMHSSTEAGGEGSAVVRPGEIHRPEFEHKKAKLLYMQEEVCRRYKHYHQQMQLVVSSFESVAGLSSATPYASLTLKAVSKQFRSLKNAISDQLRHVCKVLGDELVGSSTSSCKHDNSSVPKLKYVEPSFRRQKPIDGAIGYSDSHPIWRPQRGLPERAVSVLRAWLFDHFLHPYPTDTDKHMLATQTGLSRNQVSNWFINARVRLWKPMVEEIHMLETRGMAGMDLNSCRNSEKTDAGQGSEVATNRHGEYATAAPMTAEGSHCMEQWHQEKKSRLEDCAAMDSGGGLMSFAYQGGMDIGGLGAVSLTLGLRQGEGSQQHQIRHYGHQILHDFVG